MADPAAPREELMLDPSLLLYPAGFDAVSTVLREEPSHRIWIPERFYRAVVEEENLDAFWRDYDLPRETTPFAQVQSLFRANGPIQPFYPTAVEPFAGDELRRFQAELRHVAGGSDFLADLWYEEWVFLTSQSWIASTSRRAFDAFKTAGAIAVELPRQAFDAVVRRTPGVVPAGGPPPAALTATQRLRAVTKWVAAGGATWVTILNPIFGLAAGSAAGIFLLFDP